MLNCILSMVEKTKRALGILQQRSTESVNVNGHVNEWLPRRDSLRNSLTASVHSALTTEDVKRTAGEIMAQTIRLAEDRVAEVRRKAGEYCSIVLLRPVKPGNLTLEYTSSALNHMSYCSSLGSFKS